MRKTLTGLTVIASLLVAGYAQAMSSITFNLQNNAQNPTLTKIGYTEGTVVFYPTALPAGISPGASTYTMDSSLGAGSTFSFDVTYQLYENAVAQSLSFKTSMTQSTCDVTPKEMKTTAFVYTITATPDRTSAPYMKCAINVTSQANEGGGGGGEEPGEPIPGEPIKEATIIIKNNNP